MQDDTQNTIVGEPLTARRAEILKAIKNRTYEYAQLPELTKELGEIEAALQKEPALFSRAELDEMTACLTVEGTLEEGIETRVRPVNFKSDNVAAFMVDALHAMIGEG